MFQISQRVSRLAMTAICLVTASAAFADPAIMAPKNPYLADVALPMVHDDPSQSDALLQAGPTGIHQLDESQILRAPAGPLNATAMGPVTYPNGDQVVWTNSPTRVAKILVSNGQYKEIVHYVLPHADYISPEKTEEIKAKLDSAKDEAEMLDYVSKTFPLYLETVASRSGIYSMLGAGNELILLSHNKIVVLGDKDPNDAYSPIVIKRSFDIPPAALATWTMRWRTIVPRLMSGGGAGGLDVTFSDIAKILQDFVLALNMTYDGHIVFATVTGTVGIIDKEFKGEPQLVNLNDGGLVTNSFAVDDKGGIYIASNKAMHKVVWTGTKLSTDEADGAWVSEYDNFEGDHGGARSGSTGTGSTPTLMGFGPDEDKLVVITDGSKRMKLVAFWRDQIPADFKQKPGTKSPRIADQIEVSFGRTDLDASQSEQSVAVLGTGAFVVNNTIQNPVKGGLETVLVSGVTREGPRGVERLDWDKASRSFKETWWQSDISSPSTVPMISAGSSQVYFNRYVDKAWEVTGLDWETGAVKTRLITNGSQAYNGAYTVIQVLPEGDIVYGALLGSTRLHVEK